MTKIAIKRDWRAPYPSDWRSNFHSFVEACKAMEVRKMEAQYFFSHIIRTEEWREEMMWENWVTGEVYESEEDIPPYEDTVSQTRRWKTQQEFLSWCDDNVPGFVDSTFWNRHLLIDKWTEVGMDLVDAVKIVAGLQAFTPSKLVLEVFEFDDYHRCTGYKPELASNLPTLKDETRDKVEELVERKQVAEESGDEEEKVRIQEEIIQSLPGVADAAEEYIKEKSYPIENKVATPRSVSGDIKKEINRKPRCSVRYALDDSPYHWMLRVEYPGEGGYIEKTKKFYIQVISEHGEVMSPEDLPEEALEWWHRKFSMYNQLHKMGRR